ncbi:hypothetical protein F3Y22_tig00110045pilonHSYRG00065 [Hibiscus syriacus]|uniref:Uncharacterized protein n=1 Tax=Hibiscus syriacus TaxID=106335 RepID=A0A6A3BKB3_HIBSY|nr:uncharacterized protein LOC120213964 [Hibiscus syriacus]KAE8717440.1 hypothetical protein F3Y22_tig00110045pilonHSYRG00065 [Hibiscus syriacus]
MFGRVRASPSLDSSASPPSKIIKHDSLSIYETTLMKLKLGCQFHPISPVDLTDCHSGTIPVACEEMHSGDESMVIDTDCSSDCQSTGDSKLISLQRSNCTSNIHLFSRFNSRQRTPTISDETLMMDINASASSFQSLSRAKEGNHESTTHNGSTIT